MDQEVFINFPISRLPIHVSVIRSFTVILSLVVYINRSCSIPSLEPNLHSTTDEFGGTYRCTRSPPHFIRIFSSSHSRYSLYIFILYIFSPSFLPDLPLVLIFLSLSPSSSTTHSSPSTMFLLFLLFALFFYFIFFFLFANEPHKSFDVQVDDKPRVISHFIFRLGDKFISLSL